MINLSTLRSTELDAMTSSKTNPVIMVPLNRGLNRGQRPSEELSPIFPAESPAVEVLLHAHSAKDGPLARNNQQLNQAISPAPPVPVRIGKPKCIVIGIPIIVYLNLILFSLVSVF